MWQPLKGRISLTITRQVKCRYKTCQFLYSFRFGSYIRLNLPEDPHPPGPFSFPSASWSISQTHFHYRNRLRSWRYVRATRGRNDRWQMGGEPRVVEEPASVTFFLLQLCGQCLNTDNYFSVATMLPVSIREPGPWSFLFLPWTLLHFIQTTVLAPSVTSVPRALSSLLARWWQRPGSLCLLPALHIWALPLSSATKACGSTQWSICSAHPQLSNTRVLLWRPFYVWRLLDSAAIVVLPFG